MSDGRMNRVTPTDVGMENPSLEMDDFPNADTVVVDAVEEIPPEPEPEPELSNINQLNIYQCARTGHIDGLKALLKQKRVRDEVNKLDDKGMNPLHYASRFNQFEAVRTLVEIGYADVSSDDRERATALHYAARKKQTDHAEGACRVITYLVEHGADVNATDKYMSTPLHFAAMRGNEVVAQALLQCDEIAIDQEDHRKATPLLEAVTYNYIGVVRMLLEQGCQARARDSEDSTSLHLASMNEVEVEMVEMLLEYVPEDRKKGFIDCPDIDCNTALHLAVENRNTDLVAFLLQQGASVNAVCRPDSNGYTALHLACITGDPEITALLLKHGARADVADKNMTLPLHRAAQYRHTEVVKLLLQHSKSHLEARDDEMFTPLLTACCYDNAELVQCLLENGADIKASEDQDRSAIYLAADNDQPAVVKVLIERLSGRDKKKLMNSSDRFDNTPLHVATRNGYYEVAKTLLQAGAKHDLKNEEEETPFLLGAANGHASVCRGLLAKSRGKCLNDEDEDSNSALHLAAEAGHADVVELLLAKGGDKEARNCYSWTPLDFAAASGHVEIVKMLLDEEAPVDAMDKSKTTPLHLASKNGHVDVVKLLLDYGADLFIEDLKGNSALDMAIDKGNEDVASAIAQSEQWREAAMHDTYKKLGSHSIRNTPLRKMIRKMPDVAKMIFDRCVTTELCNPEKPEFWVEFNFELIDDTLSKWDKTGEQNVAFQDDLYDQDGVPKSHAAPYIDQSTAIKENHPLMLMVKFEQEHLLSHPLVLALIRRKWSIASFFYFSFLLFYMVFLGFLSAYVIEATPPYDHDVMFNRTRCESGEMGNMKSGFEELAQVIIIICAAIGIIFEGFQLFATKSKYLRTVVNLFDWFTYISAVLVVIDFTPCGLRTEWQWQLSAFCVFVAWMDLLLFLRRLPQIGIYVVMIVEIFFTFMKFFLVFFLFIVAFALSFYILLRNQSAFRSPFYSLMKTWVMMIGEMDFTEIFHENEDSTAHDDQLFYEESTYAIFIAFLVLMAIIIMNLLTGLAVDDVNLLQEKAELKKLTMQIELALDVEIALPKRMRRWTRTIVQKERVYPNVDKGWTNDALQVAHALADGEALSQKRYISQVISEADPGVDDRDREIKDLEHSLRKAMDSNQRETEKRLESIEKMMKALIKSSRRSPSLESRSRDRESRY